MRITLRDVQSGKEYAVDGVEASFGRDVARCQIAILEKSVSNVHAKLSLRGGRWYLEDQGSSNGTYIAGSRLSGAAELHEGDEFSLFRYVFKVVRIEGAYGAEAGDDEEDFRSAATQMLAKDSPASPRAVEERIEPGAGASGRSAYHSTSVDQLPSREGGARPVGILPVFAHALRLYLTTLPRLLLSPRVTIENGVARPAFAAMTGLKLGLFAAAAFMLGAFFSGLAAAVVAVVLGGALTGSLIGLSISLAISLAVGIVIGFILHPVLGWLVRILGGTSTEVTRTSYAVASFQATVLLQALAAAGVLLLLLPVPFLFVAQVLLGLFGSLLVLYTSYVWLESFGVFRWVRVLVLVVMAFMILSSAWSIQGGVRAKVAGATAAPVSLLAELKTFIGGGDAEVSDTSTPPPAAGKPAAGVVVVTPAPVAEAPAPPPAAGVVEVAPTVEDPAPSYREFQRKLDEIERVIGDDPTLLVRAVGVRALYKKLHEEIAKVDDRRNDKGKAKAARKDLFEERMRQALVYEATASIVDDLFVKAVESPVFAATVQVEEKPVKKKPGKNRSPAKNK